MEYISSTYIGNIGRLSEARFAAGMMVDMIGFPVAVKNKNCISHAAYEEISSWIVGPSLGIEIDEDAIDNLKELTSLFKPNFVHILCTDIPKNISTSDVPIIIEISIEDTNTIENLVKHLTQPMKSPLKGIVINTSSTLLNDLTLWKPLSAITSLFLSNYNNLAIKKIKSILESDIFSGIYFTGSKDAVNEDENFEKVGNLLEALEFTH